MDNPQVAEIEQAALNFRMVVGCMTAVVITLLIIGIQWYWYRKECR